MRTKPAKPAKRKGGPVPSYGERAATGRKLVTVWLDEEAQEALARLVERHGSQRAAVEAAIIAAARRAK